MNAASDVADPAPLFPPCEILLEDGPVLAVHKPAGLLTLGAHPEIPTLERQIKDWIKARFQKPGNVYLGIPHRLDRPVSGVLLFARNSKAAARLAEQFRTRQVHKVYWGITTQPPDPPQGTLVDWLLKTPDQAHVTVVPPETLGAREAILHYRTVCQTPLGPLLEIELETGRMHQIRVQLAHQGWPIVGDIQYGAQRLLIEPLPEDKTLNPIALHARQITFLHPVRYDSVTVVAPVPANWGNLNLPEVEVPRSQASASDPEAAARDAAHSAEVEETAGED